MSIRNPLVFVKYWCSWAVVLQQQQQCMYMYLCVLTEHCIRLQYTDINFNFNFQCYSKTFENLILKLQYRNSNYCSHSAPSQSSHISKFEIL